LLQTTKNVPTNDRESDATVIARTERGSALRRWQPATVGASGDGAAIFEASGVRSYDLVLNLLEREVKREARKRAGRTAQSAAVFLITAGLIILATLGFAAARCLMRCPVPAVSVTAFYRRGSLAGLGGHSEVNLRTRRKEGKR